MDAVRDPETVPRTPKLNTTPTAPRDDRTGDGTRDAQVIRNI